MREEFLVLRQYKIADEAPIQELLQDQFIPGTLEHVLFDYDPKTLEPTQKCVIYPDAADYRFISFSGAGVKTKFHCFRTTDKC